MTKNTPDPSLLEALLRSATDCAIIALDARNNVTTWSDGAEALLGWCQVDFTRSAAIIRTYKCEPTRTLP